VLCLAATACYSPWHDKRRLVTHANYDPGRPALKREVRPVCSSVDFAPARLFLPALS